MVEAKAVIVEKSAAVMLLKLGLVWRKVGTSGVVNQIQTKITSGSP